jgi:hypothetical protein
MGGVDSKRRLLLGSFPDVLVEIVHDIPDLISNGLRNRAFWPYAHTTLL